MVAKQIWGIQWNEMSAVHHLHLAMWNDHFGPNCEIHRNCPIRYSLKNQCWSGNASERGRRFSQNLSRLAPAQDM